MSQRVLVVGCGGIGGVMTLQAHGENAMHGSVDYSPVIGQMRGFQRVFQQMFPAARGLVGESEGTAHQPDSRANVVLS